MTLDTEYVMPEMPVYLKIAEDMPRPTDAEFYWLTRDGPYLCRNHPFFETDVPAPRPPRSLATHRPRCRLRYPRLPRRLLEDIVGFFDLVYQAHGSESLVLLFWDMERQDFVLVVPEQEATVWESSLGTRSPLDVGYTIPLTLPPRHLLVGDVHCHGDLSAYASSTDRDDEEHRDGIHVVVGRIDREPPSFHAELAVDGHRFSLDFDQVFEGYEQRSAGVPADWLERVKVKVKRPLWSHLQRHHWPNGW